MLEEEVYMKLPPGLKSVERSNKVCKFNRSLYGLKQSPRVWFERFTKVILKNGYKQSLTDHTLFIKVTSTNKKAILIVYVDDIILTGDDEEEISNLKKLLNREFKIKDLGKLRYFLGMEVPADTPMEANLRFNKEDGSLVDREKFQRLVGKLIYLSLTRPDIDFPVNVISQHMTNPNEEHIAVANRILKYLKRTPGHGLMFKKTQDRTVKIFTDSSWAGDLTEEYHFEVLCDNQSAILIAKNPVQHDRTKHVEIDRHFIVDQVNKRTATLSYIPTNCRHSH
ncbi:Cysteine-rich RLK (receptor-like protein kinase) 8 [Gossypium australe]|uniref:Cysteine-rich RLK (Receptor-like protein kinase) 8 n=1 Tax=Gossypium australe TaxID=47621 RepID=A0A5B6VBN0_9ROSI|nr:Cysteine-rich RLK (receptor-like protein kinase) 8 [Gossypium australe]